MKPYEVPSRLLSYAIGSQIKNVLECKGFPKELTGKDKAAWDSFIAEVQGFLCNHYVENDGTTVSIHDAHPENVGAYSLRGARRELPPGYTGQHGENVPGDYNRKP